MLSQLTNLKLQWREVFGSKLHWLYAYFKSSVEKYVVSIDAFVFNFCRIVSIKLSILGIWYVFLCINLFSIFESSANLNKFISFNSYSNWIYELCRSNYSILISFSSNSFLSSAFTKGWGFIRTRLRFWCVSAKFLWYLGLTVCMRDLSFLEMWPGKSRAICFSWLIIDFDRSLIIILIVLKRIRVVGKDLGYL